MAKPDLLLILAADPHFERMFPSTAAQTDDERRMAGSSISSMLHAASNAKDKTPQGSELHNMLAPRAAIEAQGVSKSTFQHTQARKKKISILPAQRALPGGEPAAYF